MCKNITTVEPPPEMTLREAASGKTQLAKVFYETRSDEEKKETEDHGNAGGPGASTCTYTMKEVVRKAAEGKIWIVVHDRVYNLTEYQHEHPGGNLVLQHMAGKDATDAFENYHRAHVAKYLLPRYYIGNLHTPRPVSKHVQDFRGLRQELLRRGMFEVPAGYYNTLYIWLASLFVASCYLTIFCTTLSAHMTGAVLMGLFWQQFAGLGHDLGHSSVSKNFRGDHRVGSTIGSIFTGLSTVWWKRDHNNHHVVPNSIEDDGNIQHMPFLAIAEKMIEEPFWSSYQNKLFRMDTIAAAFISYQHYFFLPLMCVARFNLYAMGIKHLVNPRFKTEFTNTELFCILGVFPVWVLALANTLPSRGEMVAWIVLSHAVTMVLHLQIVVSHWSMEVYSTTSLYGKEENTCAEEDWYTLQLRTTMDINCPAWLDWFHIGLQFQTAHHLFPTLPRSHLRAATKMVKDVCRKNNLPFRSMPFLPLVGESMRVLRETAELARTGKYTHRN